MFTVFIVGFFLFACLVAYVMLGGKKKTSDAIGSLLQSAPASQRDLDRKEALGLIEEKLIEADKQKRLSEAIATISELEVAKPSQTAKAK